VEKEQCHKPKVSIRKIIRGEADLKQDTTLENRKTRRNMKKIKSCFLKKLIKLMNLLPD
jgi:hypothetical protein